MHEWRTNVTNGRCAEILRMASPFLDFIFFDFVSVDNRVNFDFEEIKRVTMSEQGKWFEMLNGGQQFWSKETEQAFGR